jgi:DNA-binding NarL/FixJ family response regulator
MLKTLIVEDNERFRQSLKEMLINRFPSVSIEEAEDGEDALRKVDTLAPDLIFMDIKLPGESGLTVTKRIKQRFPGIIVVVLTYYDSPEHRKAADQCGADYFLPKGTSTEEVVEIVQSILSKKNAGSHKPKAG